MNTTLASVRRADGRIWIEGLRGFGCGEYVSSVHGVWARSLEYLGEPLSYADLVGYDGFAFRISVHVALCPSAGHPCCGYPCHQRGGEAIPWQREFIEGAPWSPAATNREAFEAAARAAVLENLERGLPVEYGSEENGLIVGASSDGQRWLCLHPYHKDGRESFWHDEVGGFAGGAWPWFIGLWREPKPAAARPSAEALRLGGLKQAVAMWSSERVGDYLVGEAAYDHWLTWLRGIEDGAVEDFSGGLQGNGWVYAVLHHSRAVAARWLTAQAATVSGEAAHALLAAADQYAQLADGLIAEVANPWAIAGPGQPEAWTSVLRRQQIRRLEAARTHDATAIASVQRAVECLSAG